MLAYTYIDNDDLRLINKPKPDIVEPHDVIIKVTLSSICTSDLHIKHGFVPRAGKGVTLGHEFVGVVVKTGKDVKKVHVNDRVAVNVETFCGECFFCKRGYVNNCTHENGGWALGCRIDGGQAEYVRIPYADNALTVIPDNVTDRQALFTGDLLSTGYWSARISDIKNDDTVLVIGAGPTGYCVITCALLYNPERIIVCETDDFRRNFIKSVYPDVETVDFKDLDEYIKSTCPRGGADVVFDVAGTDDSFAASWKYARPNGIVTLVAMYENNQILPLPYMYGKNLTFKTGGVDACNCCNLILWTL